VPPNYRGTLEGGAAGTATLGCAVEYTVLAFVEVGAFGQSYAELSGFTSLDWDRRLDETSEAHVTIPVTPECCAVLGGLRTWHYGIIIYRDGKQVWDGPIVQIEQSPAEVTITARDITAILSKRWLPRDLCFSDDTTVCNTNNVNTMFGPRSPEFVAAILITEALGTLDAHGGFVTLVNQSDDQFEAYFKEFGGPVYDLLTKLAANYINFTALGRNIIISTGGLTDGTAIAQTAMLTCDDFYSDGFSAIESGLSASSQVAFVANDTVNDSTAETNIGVAGGYDSYYGLLQTVLDGNDLISESSDPPAIALAKAAQNSISVPPPIVLSTNGARLTTTAPVTIEELVPGTLVPVFADCLCTPTSGMFMLTRLSVTFDATGETVTPTLVSLGSDNDTGVDR
jgi:hypothetical protein